MRAGGPIRIAAAALVGLSSFPSVARALEEPYCTVPANCAPDRLSIRFASTGTSELDGLGPGDETVVEVVLDVKSQGVQGFSFGVRFDSSLIEVVSATYQGADPFVEDAARQIEAAGAPPPVRLHSPSGCPMGSLRLPDGSELPVKDGLKLAVLRFKGRRIPTLPALRIMFANPCAAPLCCNVPAYVLVSGRTKSPLFVDNAIISGPPADTGRFSRGDATGDGRVNVSDAVALIRQLFVSWPVVYDCPALKDVNDDGATDVSDAVALLSYLFLSGPPPPQPFQTCGVDPTPDSLGCPAPNCY
jgi:Dockerin type I domain